jgi:hypothetical protein
MYFILLPWGLVRLKQLFHCRGLKLDIEIFVKQCATCQQAKHERTHAAGLLQPLPIPNGAWQDISMDLIQRHPKSEGSNSILVIVDRFTKYAHFIPLAHPFTVKQVVMVVLDVVVQFHGMHKSIVTDKDLIFTSSFWKELFRLNHTSLLTITAYHPQTDGQIEHVNQCLDMFLWCSMHDTPRKWKSWLPLAEFWYDTSYHSSLGCTPFKAMYGYDLTYHAAPMLSTTTDKLVQEVLIERQLQTELLKQHLHQS